MTLEIGQQLYFAGSQQHQRNGFVRVEKVGTKWVHISNGHKLDRLTLRADGGGYMSPGQCYLTEDDYLSEKASSEAWDRLRRVVGDQYAKPPGLSAENIGLAREILGL